METTSRESSFEYFAVGTGEIRNGTERNGTFYDWTTGQTCRQLLVAKNSAVSFRISSNLD